MWAHLQDTVSERHGDEHETCGLLLPPCSCIAVGMPCNQNGESDSFWSAREPAADLEKASTNGSRPGSADHVLVLFDGVAECNVSWLYVAAVSRSLDDSAKCRAIAYSVHEDLVIPRSCEAAPTSIACVVNAKRWFKILVISEKRTLTT